MDHASGVPDLSFHLLDEITDGFSPDRILGTGSFGKVYKGVQRNGKKIAVKVLHDMIALDDKQFINEYNNLTKLQHQNIVRLVGYCQENKKVYVNYEGRLVIAEEIKRVLCFEYLHNGSLANYLFDEHHGQDWSKRYIIIKGICNGLKYLHEDLEPPMYHLDLKPANILLDENMEPKIADFGLSRLFGEEKTRTTTSSIGTLGYLPPEYIERNIISNKLDIFSLGVIVVKIITGRSGYSKCFEMPPQQFIQLVQKNWRNRLQKPTEFEEVKRCIEIALRCLEVDRHSRPTIGEIVHQLSETVIHNLFTQPPHLFRNDPVTLDNGKNVPVSSNKQQGNDSGPSTQQDPTVLAIVNESNKCIPFGAPLPELWHDGLASLSKLTASSRLGPVLEGAAASGSGPLSKVEVEMLALRGEFSNDDREVWTEEELERHIVQGRDGEGFVLGDDVSERRHPPKLADEVCHLEGISRDRAFHISKDGTTAEAEFLWELRKYVLLLATLAASVTYSAGLSPPGGFWPDGGVLLAGDPVLPVTYPRRYNVFFYCNATAFAASLVIVNLLLIRSLCHGRRWLRALQATMMLDQFSLMGAYAAGSCRDDAMSTYVFVLVALVVSYVSAQVFALFAPSARGSDMDTPDGSVERARKYLLIFATLVATITYQAGLRTPGGFWPGSQANDHLAGDFLLRSHHPFRFMVFFYSNTTAFVASLVVVMLLMRNTVSGHGFRSWALWVCTGAAMVGLMGAFASGSCRSLKTSIYVVALVVAVLFYIALQALVYFCEPLKNLIHDAQVAVGRYLKFERLEQQLHQHQQSRASEHGDCEAYQILRNSRMYLLLLGILAASVAYQAGLSPPGGFWQHNAADGQYLAGDSILYITYPSRYLAFFYCNATAFIASLVILILLLSNIFSTQRIKYCALQVAMILDLFALIGAYAAGSWQQVSKSVYVSLLVIPVFLYIGIHIAVFMLEVFPAWAAWRQALREKMEQRAPGWLKEVFEQAEEEEEAAAERTLEKRRKLLLLLAILAASLTYQAGMNPPGGFWQESKPGGHVAGDPVLKDNYRRRYLVFFYCNATAFVASLAVIMLLVNRKLSARGIRSLALRVCVILDLVGLLGAFAAGSSRRVLTSIYVLVLIFAVLLCIALQVALVLSGTARGLATRFMSMIGAAEDDAGAGGLPSTVAGARQARDLWDEKLPKYLLLVAALAAAVTYQAAMSPPGGLWGDGLTMTNHVAGDPILASTYSRRYKAFFYCNATSFMASLVLMVLLLIERVSNTQPALLALHAAMILDLFGLMGAYAAGSCRRVTTSAYILALVVGVSVYIAVLVVVSMGVARWLRSVMDKLADRVAWCFSVHDL